MTQKHKLEPGDWESISGLVFGLRIKPTGSDYLDRLWQHITTHHQLKTLKSVILSFPQLLTQLAEEREDVRNLSDAIPFTESLVKWMSTGSATHINEASSGIVILPLLSLIQTSQYFALLDTQVICHSQLVTHVQKLGGVQGYCGGLPTAIAVAASANDDDVIPNIAVALRLAFVIGLFGEIGDNRTVPGPTMVVVRLKYEGQGEEICARFPGVSAETPLKLLRSRVTNDAKAQISAVTDPKSITISGSANTLSQLYEYAKEAGLLVQDWPLRGKWHHPENSMIAQDLSTWCKPDPRFRFRTSGSLDQLLRSNRSGQLLSSHDLSDEVIQSILASKCEWHLVLCDVARALESSQRSSHVLVSFGIGDCTPLVSFHQHKLRVAKLYAQSLFEEFARARIGCGASSIQLQQQSEQSTGHQIDDTCSIAIVGAACRLPGANNLEQLWDQLCNGRDMHRPLDTSRFDLRNGFRASTCENFVSSRSFYGNFLEDIESFDNSFFNVSSKEASNMDPQQRVILEVAFEAMESSGYTSTHDRNNEDPVACFIGASAVDYHENTSSHPPTAYTSTGTIRSFISGKISHYFGWTGPSEVLDTACSSSLVAINRAVKSIQCGECSMALAGGVNIMTSPQYFMDLGRAGFLSQTGQCKPFDKSADGYCRADGAGLVVLKPLARALQDADQVLGIIPGVSTNQAGPTTSITVPSKSAQVSLYRSLIERSGLCASDISYVEAHGTGTPVGDPIEMESIREVFGDSKRQTVHIGSIKGNIGHCETAAGVAGLLKVLAMIKKGRLPPQANYRTLNPSIPDISEDGMAILQQETVWSDPRRMALVNSYGAAGSNSALLVCQNVQDESSAVQTEENSRACVVLTAATTSSLSAYTAVLATFLRTANPKPAFRDVVYTLSQKRQRHRFGTVFHASSIESLSSALDSQQFRVEELAVSSKPIVLVLSGQNRKCIDLSHDFYLSSPFFQSHLQRLDKILTDLSHPSILEAVFERGPINDPVILQTGMAAVQLAFARCWLAAGIRPEVIVGHSLGELVALGVSGVLSEHDCLALIGYRASLMKSQWSAEPGMMLALHADRGKTEAVVEHLSHTVLEGRLLEIACFNGPSSHVLAGSSDDVLKAKQYLDSAEDSGKGSCHLVDTTHAFHSRLADPIISDLETFCASLSWNIPRIPIESCTKSALKGYSASYVSRHARQSVHFLEAVRRLETRHKSCVFLECGMNTAIIPMTESAAGQRKNHTFVAVSTRKRTSPSSLISDVIDLLWQEKIIVNWSFLDLVCRQVWLPPYQFDKPKHFLPNVDHAAELQRRLVAEGEKTNLPLAVPDLPPQMVTMIKGLSQADQSALLLIDTSCERFGLLTKGHQVRARPMAPAALYLECAAMGLKILSPGISEGNLRFREITYQSPIGSATDGYLLLEIRRLAPSDWAWNIVLSKEPDRVRGLAHHATGRVEVRPECDFGVGKRLLGAGLSDFQDNPNGLERFSRLRAYRLFDQVVQYDEFFQGINSVTVGRKEALAQVRLPPSQPGTVNSSIRSMCDTVALDIFVQVVGLIINTGELVSRTEVMVGTAIGEILISKECALDQVQDLQVFARYHTDDGSHAVGDVLVISGTGKVLGILLGCGFNKISISRLEKLLDGANSPSKKATSAPDVDTCTAPSDTRAPPLPPTAVSVEITDLSSTETPAWNMADLCKLISAYTGMDDASIEGKVTLGELGLDSLAAMDMANELETSFGISVASNSLQDESLESLCAQRSRKNDSSDLVSGSSVIATPQDSSPKCNDPSKNAESLAMLTQILRDYSGAQEDSITADASLMDLGIDSLASLEFRQELESAFSTTLTDDITGPESKVAEIMKALGISEGSDSMQSSSVSVETRTSVLDGATATSSSLETSTDLTEVTHPVDALAASNKSFKLAAEQCGFADYWSAVADEQNELLVAYICEGFASQGLDMSKIGRDEPVHKSTITYLPKHTKVVNRFFDILVHHKILEEKDGSHRRGPGSPPSPSANDLCAAFIKKHPSYACEGELMALIGPKLSRCLEGTINAMDCLFGNPKAWTVLESFYHDAPLLSTATQQLVTFVMSYVTEFGSKRRKPLEILEVGAGTGGTTKRLVKALAASGIPVRYTFTDISRSLLRRAEKSLSQYNWIAYVVYDLEKEPPAKLRGRFDIVLGTNTVHATSDRVSVLKQMRETMNDGGFVVVSETTKVLDWCDLVFGLLDGWWLAEKGTAYPLQPANVWMKYFEAAGYGPRSYSYGTSRESNTQQLLLACKTDAFGAPKNAPPDVGPTTALADDRWRVTPMVYKAVDGVDIDADVYLPRSESTRMMAIGLLIHGGGCFTLSKKSIRPKQISYLLSQGILPISLNYRLCPQTNILDGAIADIRDACVWAQRELPSILVARGISVTSERYFVIGYSTGGHLALTTAWTLRDSSIKPPQAIVSFYAPTIFKDGALRVPPNNALPRRRKPWPEILSRLSSRPVVAHEPQGGSEAPGLAWLRNADPRSEMVLSIFAEGTGLPLLLNDIPCGSAFDATSTDMDALFKLPAQDRVEMICPLARLQQGVYNVPTFIVHGTADEVAPFEDAANFYDALQAAGVESEMLKLEGVKHLHDVYVDQGSEVWRDAVLPALKFAVDHVKS